MKTLSDTPEGESGPVFMLMIDSDSLFSSMFAIHEQ